MKMGIPEDYIDQISIFPIVLDDYLYGDCVILENMEEIEFKINHKKEVEIVNIKPLNY